MNRELVDALERAVTADPSDVMIRARLIDLYLEDGSNAQADAHALLALGLAPDDVRALELALRTASAVGDSGRVERYRRLLGQQPRRQDGDQQNPVSSASPPDDAIEEELRRLLIEEHRRQPVMLADIAGMDDVKRRLETSLLGPMRNPELRKAFAVNLRGGLLLWGPPGCGKTFLARAVAGELGANFIAVSLRDVLDPMMGGSEKNLHACFETARKAAPAVMYFDELDGLGAKRTRLRNVAWLHNIVAVLLQELDGLDDNEDVFVLGSTNQPWEVDPALRRPGRFDRTVLVLPPDHHARLAILRYHLRDVPVADDLRLEGIAKGTDNYSGADLALICRAASELAMQETFADGTVRPVNAAHLRQALTDTHSSLGPWFQNARNYALFANERGELDDLRAYMHAKRLL